MQRRVDVRRFRIGLRGLALLRGWPLDDDRRAEEQLEAIRSLLAEPPDLRALGDPGISAAYDEWAETYDHLPNLLIAAEEPLVRSMLDGVGGRLALDAACGTGRLTRVLAEHGYEVIGIDASAPMLRRAVDSAPAVRVAIGDLVRLPLASESLDVVVCGLALTHLLELDDAVAELARVLRPGGILLTTDLHPIAVATGGQAFFTAADGSRHMARNHVHWPSRYSRALGLAGLHIDRLEELFVDERFLGEMGNDAVRNDAEALLGLPLAIAWRGRKPGG